MDIKIIALHEALEQAWPQGFTKARIEWNATNIAEAVTEDAQAAPHDLSENEIRQMVRRQFEHRLQHPEESLPDPALF